MNESVCTVCHRSKKPIGRDEGAAADMCSYDCAGYLTHPKPGYDWIEPDAPRGPSNEGVIAALLDALP